MACLYHDVLFFESPCMHGVPRFVSARTPSLYFLVLCKSWLNVLATHHRQHNGDYMVAELVVWERGQQQASNDYITLNIAKNRRLFPQQWSPKIILRLKLMLAGTWNNKGQWRCVSSCGAECIYNSNPNHQTTRIAVEKSTKAKVFCYLVHGVSTIKGSRAYQRRNPSEEKKGSSVLLGAHMITECVV